MFGIDSLCFERGRTTPDLSEWGVSDGNSSEQGGKDLMETIYGEYMEVKSFRYGMEIVYI